MKRRTVATHEAYRGRQRVFGKLRPVQRNQERPVLAFLPILHAGGPAFLTAGQWILEYRAAEDCNGNREPK
jgi:hypothetical protein